MRNFFNKIKNALSKTREALTSKLYELLKGKIDEATLEELEKLLYEADLGAALAASLTQEIRKTLQKNPHTPKEQLLEILKQALNSASPLTPTILTTPHVILIVGINGSGKTTSVAKLAEHYKKQGKSVLIVAADTFRAAATEQLTLWADRVGVEIVKGQQGSDPAAVVFDALKAAQARGVEIVLIDTAGRLHVKTDLMQELHKICSVTKKFLPEAPHETLLVLDATLGQNALIQAKTFHQFTPLTGVILTKLDGTTKGGIALAIQKECGIPIRFIGTGEGASDLHPFDSQEFVRALLSV